MEVCIDPETLVITTEVRKSASALSLGWPRQRARVIETERRRDGAGEVGTERDAEQKDSLNLGILDLCSRLVPEKCSGFLNPHGFVVGSHLENTESYKREGPTHL
jgi:hypothetical protein